LQQPLRQNPQMHRGDTCQDKIIGIERGCHGGKPAHDPFGSNVGPVSAAQEATNFVLLAHDKAPAAPFDKRRAPQDQTVTIAGEAQIARAGLAQSPDMVKHGAYCHIICDPVNKMVTKRRSERPEQSTSTANWINRPLAETAR